MAIAPAFDGAVRRSEIRVVAFKPFRVPTFTRHARRG
jgi:hypothetical protein